MGHVKACKVGVLAWRLVTAMVPLWTTGMEVSYYEGHVNGHHVSGHHVSGHHVIGRSGVIPQGVGNKLS